jgi:O-antigen/teichoic acid export membrane protein
MFSGHFKALSKDIIYYGIGNMLYSIIQFITMPIIVKNFSKSQVANWNILLPTGILLAAIVTFGMDSAVVRFVKDADTEKEKKAIFSTGLLFEIGLTIVVAFFMWFFAKQFQTSLQLSSDNKGAWFILILWLPCLVIGQYFQNWFKYNFQRSIFLKSIFTQSGIYLTCIILMKVSNNLNLFNVIIAMLFSQLATVLIGFYYCSRLIVFTINIALLKKLIFYGLPFMIFAFGYNFITSIDRFILAGKINKDDFAIYTQAFRISAIISMIVSSFNFAFGPFLLSLLGKEEASSTLSRLQTYYLMIMVFMGLCFFATSKVIIILLSNASYINGYKFMYMFVIGYIFYGLYSFAQSGIIHSRKSYLNLYILTISLIVVFLIDFFLAPIYKGYGTALGFMITNILMVVLGSLFSSKHISITYNYFTDSILVLFLFLGGFLLLFFNMANNIYIDAAIKLCFVVLTYFPILFFLLIKTEKLYIKNVFFRFFKLFL